MGARRGRRYLRTAVRRSGVRGKSDRLAARGLRNFDAVAFAESSSARIVDALERFGIERYIDEIGDSLTEDAWGWFWELPVAPQGPPIQQPLFGFAHAPAAPEPEAD